MLHNDIVAGGTNVKKLWEDGSQDNISYTPPNLMLVNMGNSNL